MITATATISSPTSDCVIASDLSFTLVYPQPVTATAIITS